MCMKYVNANVQCFDNSVSQYWFGNGTLSSFVKTVECSEEGDGKYKVEKFGVLVFINIRGSENDKSNNPLEQKKKLEFKIRLTRLSKIPDEKLSYDLTDFTIDLSDKHLIQKACFDYIDLIKVINVSDLELKSVGDYVIKLLVREEGEKLYDIQMVHRLTIESTK